MSTSTFADEQTAQIALICHCLYLMLYHELDEDQLERFKQSEIFSPHTGFSCQLSTALSNTGHLIQHTSVEDLKTIRNDFNQLFLTPGCKFTPPWGSVYCNRNNEIFDEFTMEVCNYYKRNGLSLDTGTNEPEDHIGLMFAFVFYLFSQAEHNKEKFYKIINDFTKNYILTWSERFLTLMEKNVATEYYRCVATLAKYLLTEIVSITSAGMSAQTERPGEIFTETDQTKEEICSG